ncbi:hypothetical protein F5Y11DRAFT_22630 [Daldinia sp. FL1419]|nr:hypothetical protein F5Y11DRAFT_22630 [Daldinia sp. FL1419]
MLPDRNNRANYGHEPFPKGRHRAYFGHGYTGLVWVSDLDTSQKLLKSHVAKRTHAISRRSRVIEYQQQKETSNGVPSEAIVANRSPQLLDAGVTTGELYCDQTLPGFHNSCDDLVPCDHSRNRAIICMPPLRGDAFNYFSVPLSPLENSLIHHYIHSIINSNPSSCYSPYQLATLRDWLPTAIADPGMRMALFLCASRSLHARTGARQYLQYALQYKAICLRMLSDAIGMAHQMGEAESGSLVSDATISTALQLASDEFAAGDTAAFGSHINAVSQMVTLNGGIDKVHGMNGFLQIMIQVLVAKRRVIEAFASDNRDNVRLYTLDYFFSYLFT